MSQAHADKQTSDPWRGCCGCALDEGAGQVFGLAWSGVISTPRIDGLLCHLRSGCTEIYPHPDTRNDFAGSAPGCRYAEELGAVIDPAIGALACRDVALAGYCDARATTR